MNNKKITAADLDPQFLIQIINKNGDLTEAEKALASSCVGRDERIGEHQLPIAYTKSVNDKITALQNKVAQARMLATKIDKADLSANINNEIDNIKQKIDALQARNATIVYQSGSGSSEATQRVFDNINKQISDLNVKVIQNEKRSQRNETNLNQNITDTTSLKTSHTSLQQTVGEATKNLQLLSNKQALLAKQQDSDIITIQNCTAQVSNLDARVAAAETTVEAIGKRLETSSQEALSQRLDEQGTKLDKTKAQQDINIKTIDDMKVNIGVNTNDIAALTEELDKKEKAMLKIQGDIGALTETVKANDAKCANDISIVKNVLDGEVESRSQVTSDLTEKLNQTSTEVATMRGNVQILQDSQAKGTNDFNALKSRYDALEVNVSSDFASLKKRADNIDTAHNKLSASTDENFKMMNSTLEEFRQKLEAPVLRKTLINAENAITREDLAPELTDELNEDKSDIEFVRNLADSAKVFQNGKPGQMIALNDKSVAIPKNLLTYCYFFSTEEQAVEMKKQHMTPLVDSVMKIVYTYDASDDPNSEEGKKLIAKGEELSGDGYTVDKEFFERIENVEAFYYDARTEAVWYVTQKKEFLVIYPGMERFALSVPPKGTSKLSIGPMSDPSRITVLSESSFVFEEEDGQKTTYTVRQKPENTIVRIAEGIVFITNNGEDIQTYYVTKN